MSYVPGSVGALEERVSDEEARVNRILDRLCRLERIVGTIVAANGTPMMHALHCRGRQGSSPHCTCDLPRSVAEDVADLRRLVVLPRADGGAL